MSLSKAIAAKVAAYDTSWVDPEEFAECAEKGTISIQRHYLVPYIRFGLFAIGKGEKEFPLDKLTDLSYAHNMHVVLPYDAVSPEILENLALIESRREKRREQVDKTGWKGIFEVTVVADVGEDPSTGETRYGCRPFPFSPSAISPDAIKVALCEAFKTSLGVTLSQVDEFAIRAKKWKVPQEIKGEKVLTGKGFRGGEFDIAIGTVRNVGNSDPKLMAQIEPGDIVVAVHLQPDVLDTFCQKVGGLITDKGGPTCYTAVFARDRIPAVVGAVEATSVLKDRQKVMVNGATGAVYV